MTTITTSENKKIYFASDQHLGAPTPQASLPREKKFVAWLNVIKEDAGAVFLLGDLFDFWFEYKYVVPKGYVRLLGKLAEITDDGIPVHMFRGNHDIWAFNYLTNFARGKIFFNFFAIVITLTYHCHLMRNA